MDHKDVTRAHIEDVLSDRVRRVGRQCEDMCEDVVCKRSRCVLKELVGVQSGWVLDAVCQQVWTRVCCGIFHPEILRRKRITLWHFVFADLSIWSRLCPQAQIVSETHRIYAPRRKGENLSKLHLIVSLVWNGKVVLRGSCFLMENYDCCRLGGFRGPSVWLLKCSTHDIMTVLPYGTADHILKSRN